MGNRGEVLYEYKTLDVFSPPPPERADDQFLGTSPYYLHSRLAQQATAARQSTPPMSSAVENAVMQQAAQGWEFDRVVHIEVQQGAMAYPYMLSRSSASAGILYRLSFRRAKHL